MDIDHLKVARYMARVDKLIGNYRRIMRPQWEADPYTDGMPLEARKELFNVLAEAAQLLTYAKAEVGDVRISVRDRSDR